MTETFVAPATTCAFVTMTPSLRTMNPVPRPAWVRGCARAEEHVERILRRLIDRFGLHGDDGRRRPSRRRAVIAFCRLCETWSLVGATIAGRLLRRRRLAARASIR